MEGANPQTIRVIVQKGPKPMFHFVGRFVRKGDGEDLMRLGSTCRNEMSDAVSKNPCFTTTSTC
jgi:hypothetical protein